MRGLADFEGHWRLERRIENAVGPDGRFAGQASFRPEGPGLIVDESGTMQLGQQPPLKAERRYLWGTGGRGIAVRFADGRAFHDFDPAGGWAEATHYCDPDRYEVVYDFTGWPYWRAEWRVTGPRKGYWMESLYSPM
ncbi:DUF6314 family protein [Pseudooceanicola sp. 502str34]